jgi:RecJ-like exonuclease
MEDDMDKTKVYIDLTGDCGYCNRTGKASESYLVCPICQKFYYDVKSARPDGKMPCGHRVESMELRPPTLCKHCNGTGMLPVKMTLFDLMGMIADEMEKEGDA